MAYEPQFNQAKFSELLLYVAERSEDDVRFGATKLNKIMFFSDFLAYGMWGESITGATYRRLPRGPAPRELLSVREQLIDAGKATLQEARYFNYPQHRLVAVKEIEKEIDRSLFNGAELALVDQVIAALKDRNASEVSELSHCEIGWRLVDDNEDIPYSTVFLSSDSPTSMDQKRALQLTEEYGWHGQ